MSTGLFGRGLTSFSHISAVRAQQLKYQSFRVYVQKLKYLKISAVTTVRNTRRFFPLFLNLNRNELGVFLTQLDENIIYASVFVISGKRTLSKIENVPRFVELKPLLQLGG